MIILRRISSGDFKTLIDFFNSNNVIAITSTFNPFPLNTETATWISTGVHKDRYYLALNTTDNCPVGFSMLRGWDAGYETPSFGIFVDLRQQGKGYGYLITELTINEARLLGCKSVRLSVYKENHKAVKIYENLGFSIKDVIHASEDHPHEKLIMIKGLK